MAQDNTKLCDFTNTNNNDFISTPIAPLTDAESCEINAALLNLVMKDQFSGLPSEDAATHLNNFVDLCEMQKKKDTDNDIVKLKLFPFSLRDRAKTWVSSLPKNSILSYLSDLTLVTDLVGIDNPLSRWLRGFICLCRCEGLVRGLLLD